ncbi:hypothetical protein [Methylophaga sp.]|uniref:hypothetical protein n=1 Tax=Methylophaga sp. TaxID=2024840 RepID=UPI003F6A39D2
MADKDNNEWQGSGQSERREEHRRKGEDRRDMIRFEPDKDDRRQGKDRRKDKNSGWDSGTTI